MLFLRPTFISLAFSLGAFATLGPVTDLHIVNANISPDGFTRSAVLAEGTFPGPVIVGNKGDNFQINVIDDLIDSTMLMSTSVHWHGLFQHTTNYNDGPSFVNQCPIAKGDSYLYDFNVPDQAGTFWYHSHLSTQYCDGLRGALVVYDPADPHASLYDVDDENTIITLADWYHVVAPTAGAAPRPAATLINRLGRYTNGPASPLAVVNVVYGARYRFRLVAISCAPNFVFSIDSHTFSVIEADGVNVSPLVVDSIQIYAGQRYSIVLNANQTIGNYWIRALSNAGPSTFLGGLNSAILRYTGATIEDPTTLAGLSLNPLQEQDLAPLVSAPAPGAPNLDGADVSLNLALGFSGGAFTINGVSFVPPTVPVLLQILSGASDAASLLPSGSIYTLPPNKTIQISMPGLALGGPHPFHLHGHTFSVIRSAGSETYNYANPPQRDVVSVGSPLDNVTIRFVTDNSGPWFLHCHIDWHLEAGFAIVFAEDTVSTASANPVSAAWKDLCPKYNALNPSDLGGAA